MKTVQRFSDDYLESCQEMTPDQIIQFLDDFRRLHGTKQAPTKLISLKVPTDLLNAFRAKSAMSGTPYQSQIKALMKAWVLDAADS